MWKIIGIVISEFIAVVIYCLIVTTFNCPSEYNFRKGKITIDATNITDGATIETNEWDVIIINPTNTIECLTFDPIDIGIHEN